MTMYKRDKYSGLVSPQQFSSTQPGFLALTRGVNENGKIGVPYVAAVVPIPLSELDPE